MARARPPPFSLEVALVSIYGGRTRALLLPAAVPGPRAHTAQRAFRARGAAVLQGEDWRREARSHRRTAPLEARVDGCADHGCACCLSH